VGINYSIGRAVDDTRSPRKGRFESQKFLKSWHLIVMGYGPFRLEGGFLPSAGHWVPRQAGHLTYSPLISEARSLKPPQSPTHRLPWLPISLRFTGSPGRFRINARAQEGAIDLLFHDHRQGTSHGHRIPDAPDSASFVARRCKVETSPSASAPCCIGGL